MSNWRVFLFNGNYSRFIQQKELFLQTLDDRIEKAEKETMLSKQINSYAPKQFSRAINKIGGNLLHISSNYVFDGEQNTPYKENQKTTY